MTKTFYPYFQFQIDCEELANELTQSGFLRDLTGVYGIPRGGLLLAQHLAHLTELPMVVDATPQAVADDPSILVVDDIVDSGSTRLKFPRNVFISLHGRPEVQEKLKSCEVTKIRHTTPNWIVYWWELGTQEQAGPAENIIRLLEYIGEDPDRDGLKETPSRVLRSYEELFSGYKVEDPAAILKTFENDEDKYDQIVLQKGIEFYSMCEHHMIPFFGTADIAYIPGEEGRIIGLSKLCRLVEVYSRRLQVQERLGQQVVSALMEHLKPLGAACRIEARHLCISGRGVNKQHSTTITQSIKGVFIEDSTKGLAARTELSNMLR